MSEAVSPPFVEFADLPGHHRDEITDSISVQEIPQEDGPEWDGFCALYDIDQLAGPRRGWWSALSTYIRGATHVLLVDGCRVGVIMLSRGERVLAHAAIAKTHPPKE